MFSIIQVENKYRRITGKHVFEDVDRFLIDFDMGLLTPLIQYLYGYTKTLGSLLMDLWIQFKNGATNVRAIDIMICNGHYQHAGPRRILRAHKKTNTSRSLIIKRIIANKRAWQFMQALPWSRDTTNNYKKCAVIIDTFRFK